MRLVAQTLHAEAETFPDSYRGLADVFHELLADQSLDTLLERIADTLRTLVPYEELVVYETDDPRGELRPVLVRREYAAVIESTPVPFGEGYYRLGGDAP